MKKIIFGIIIGVLLCTTGIYATLEQKTKDVVKKENVEKINKAAQEIKKVLLNVVK